jgi:hypothetical protein
MKCLTSGSWQQLAGNAFVAATTQPAVRPGASPAASGWRPKGARTRGIFTSKADIARYIEAHNKGAPNPSNCKRHADGLIDIVLMFRP